MINSIPIPVQHGVLKLLRSTTSASVRLQNFSFIQGGCINAGGKIETSAGQFFLKWNDAQKYPNMFEAEARGLTILRAPHVINIPLVIGYEEEDAFQFILLEFIESESKSRNFWTTLGNQLAALHHITSAQAGLDHSNYIGSLPQYNTMQPSWTDFFITQRLDPQLKLMENPDRSLVRQFETLYNKLPCLLVEEKHALLHGDLWSGNLLVNERGEPCLIDPAVYYGNREMELAFTQLFGGFDQAFYSGYQERYPLQPGFPDRAQLYNLYPLLVHANLFGGGYLAQVKSILRKFL